MSKRDGRTAGIVVFSLTNCIINYSKFIVKLVIKMLELYKCKEGRNTQQHGFAFVSTRIFNLRENVIYDLFYWME